jgi:hypothetical protein
MARKNTVCPAAGAGPYAQQPAPDQAPATRLLTSLPKIHADNAIRKLCRRLKVRLNLEDPIPRDENELAGAVVSEAIARLQRSESKTDGQTLGEYLTAHRSDLERDVLECELHVYSEQAKRRAVCAELDPAPWLAFVETQTSETVQPALAWAEELLERLAVDPDHVMHDAMWCCLSQLDDLGALAGGPSGIIPGEDAYELLRNSLDTIQESDRRSQWDHLEAWEFLERIRCILRRSVRKGKDNWPNVWSRLRKELSALEPWPNLAVLRAQVSSNLGVLWGDVKPLPPLGGEADIEPPPQQSHEELVRGYLDAHPEARMDEVIKGTSLTKRRIERTAAWKAHFERMVDRYLRSHPSASLANAAAEFGVKNGTIFNTEAWKAHMARKELTKPPRKVKERALSEIAVRCRPDERTVDPGEKIEAQEYLFRQILEHAATEDPETQGKLNGLPRDEQKEMLDCVLSQIRQLGPGEEYSQEDVDLALGFAGAWLSEHDQGRRQARNKRC